MSYDPQQLAAPFLQAKAQALAAVQVAKQRANKLSMLRLVGFFVLIAAIVLAGVEVHPLAGIAVAALGLAGFNKLVGRQRALDQEVALQERIAERNQGEIEAVNYRFARFGDGASYRDNGHPYTGDLDIFGPNAVFQQLNRSGSLVGELALAHYCQTPLGEVAAINQRQQAIQAIVPAHDWRMEFAALGEAEPVGETAITQLRSWARSPAVLQERYWAWLIPALSVFNLLWLGSFVYLPFYLALVGFAPSIYLLYRAKPAVDIVHQQTEQAVEFLQSYQRMIALVEASTWDADLLRSLRSCLVASAVPSASETFAQLASASRQLNVRVNPFVLLLNLFSFWEIRYARQLGRIKREALAQTSDGTFPASLAFPLPGEAYEGRTRLDQWLLALGAMDALCSFAATSYRWPSWTFPTVVDSAAEASATEVLGEGLHHPLLDPQVSVGNNFRAASRAGITLLTGSNMAGKSTFLRTVGLHISMAHWGCAVPAKRLQLPLLRVYTSMRTQDDLHQGTSAFYAELKRLRTVVDATRRGENVFILLDEILKGTNSQDRHEGGRALITQLIAQGGAGIIATHDLELGKMAEERNDIQTLRLEVETNDEGELYFDYTVKPGLAQSRNASVLMKQMGLGTAD